MAKMKNEKERKIYNVEEIKSEKTLENVKSAKTKPKNEKQLGSLGTAINKCGNSLKKEQNLPDIRSLEKQVLQYIIGQDKQVRQIITAIYRAINFKTIKSNVLIIGNSGTGKTETIKQIAERLHIPYTVEDAT